MDDFRAADSNQFHAAISRWFEIRRILNVCARDPDARLKKSLSLFLDSLPACRPCQPESACAVDACSSGVSSAQHSTRNAYG
jgi:hypothetical protein